MRPCILLIDDDDAILRVVARILGRRFELVCAQTGAEALERLRAAAGAFDAVLCDLNLPDMSGPRLFATLCAEFPALEARTAFLTGGGFTEEARALLATTTQPRLDKPFELAELEALVTRLTGASAGRKAPEDV